MILLFLTFLVLSNYWRKRLKPQIYTDNVYLTRLCINSLKFTKSNKTKWRYIFRILFAKFLIKSNIPIDQFLIKFTEIIFAYYFLSASEKCSCGVEH